MRHKGIATGFFEVFIKPTAQMTASVTAATGVSLALNYSATAVYEYATGKINNCELETHPDAPPPNYHI